MRRWICMVVIAVAMAGCTSKAAKGDGPPTGIATSGPAARVTAPPPVPAADAQRAQRIARASKYVAAIASGAHYAVTGFVHATSGTVPDVTLVGVTIAFTHDVTFPAGIPILKSYSESDPQYGKPLPLQGAVIPSQDSHLLTDTILVDVDLAKGVVFAIAPLRQGL